MSTKIGIEPKNDLQDEIAADERSLMTQRRGPVLVLGATGKTGRRVAARLNARGLDVRPASRRGGVAFDWEQPATWPNALRGASAVYLTYFPDLAVPGAVEQVGAFVDLAKEFGVDKVVLLSGRGEEEAERAEHVVRESGLDWTILRCSWFNQNFSENYLLEPVLSGEVALPAGAIGEPFVDADDIADAAVAALTEDGHVGRLYELTVPRLLTFAEAVGEIGRASGRVIRYVQISPEEYASSLTELGVPDQFVWLLDYLFTTVLDGRNACLADGVRQALGRAPKDFSDYAREAAATGIWNA